MRSMYSRIVPYLYKHYRKLLKTSGLPLKRKVLSEESLNLETALSLIDNCEQMIKEKEGREISLLLDVKIILICVTLSIKQYSEFKCECADTMRLLYLHSMARDCLQNRLPQLLKDVEFIISLMQDTIDILVDFQQEPNDIKMIDVKEKFIKLLKVISTKQMEYIEFKPNFERLLKYLQNRTEPNAIPTLNTEYGMFTDLTEEDDNLFILDIFGDDLSSSGVRELLRNSLKLKKRHIDKEEHQKPTFQLTEEKTQLKFLRQSIIMPMQQLIEYFRHFRPRTTVLYLHKIQSTVQRCKHQLRK